MFSQPTVFVIGAGASQEFGMPLGAKLKHDIGHDLDFRRNEDRLIRGDRNLFALVHDKLGSQVAADELSTIIRNFQFASIDEVLHWFSDNAEIVSLGKMMIVRKILEAERSSRLFNKVDPSKIPEIPVRTWLPT